MAHRPHAPRALEMSAYYAVPRSALSPMRWPICRHVSVSVIVSRASLRGSMDRTSAMPSRLWWPVVQAALLGCPSVSGKPPHILFMVMDDMGWNDPSFHGSDQLHTATTRGPRAPTSWLGPRVAPAASSIGTPNLDHLAAAGVVLDNHHVQPVCSPSRATIMSGRHVIHTGIYMPFAQGTALRLNLSYTLLPQYLQKLNYSTHMVGRGAPSPHPNPTPLAPSDHTSLYSCLPCMDHGPPASGTEHHGIPSHRASDKLTRSAYPSPVAPAPHRPPP
eukprot:gene8555-1531_t